MRSRPKHRAGARCPSLDESTASTISAAAWASASFTSASGSVDSLEPSWGSSADALDEHPAQHDVVRGARRERPDEAARRVVEGAAGQQRRDAGVLLQGAKRVETVRQHGQVARRREAGRQALERRRGIDPDRAALPDEREQLVGDATLRPAVLFGPRRELLGTDGHRSPAHPMRDALVDEQVEVATDRHLAHVELAGQVEHPNAAVDVEAPTNQVEPLHAFQIHGVHPSTSVFGRPAGGANASRTCSRSHTFCTRKSNRDSPVTSSTGMYGGGPISHVSVIVS